eukprot:scaffold1596_cov302-Pinguiococcus_pyrenoidosus.AAC.44
MSMESRTPPSSPRGSSASPGWDRRTGPGPVEPPPSRPSTILARAAAGASPSIAGSSELMVEPQGLEEGAQNGGAGEDEHAQDESEPARESHVQDESAGVDTAAGSEVDPNDVDEMTAPQSKGKRREHSPIEDGQLRAKEVDDKCCCSDMATGSTRKLGT